jgi:transcription termination/antitermination protein NusA
VKLADVIESLTEEKGLDKNQVILIICESILAAYSKRYPCAEFDITYNRKSGDVDIFVKKEVVSSVDNDELQVSLRRSKAFSAGAKIGDVVPVPFDGNIGRIEILAAKQVIASKIRELEQLAVFEEFEDKKGSIVSGVVSKKERGGFVVGIGDVMALLPKEGLIGQEALRVGAPIKALLKEVYPAARGDFQLVLDRASSSFVENLLGLEIPEIFEGEVEIKRIVRSPGYKTKAIVVSENNDIDPVGTCIGVGGVRIKPILKELGPEKIDLIGWASSTEDLVRSSLKPAEIDKVELVNDRVAVVWLAQDQRSFAIGKMGQNIMLASRLTGIDIQLQDVAYDVEGISMPGEEELSSDSDGDIVFGEQDDEKKENISKEKELPQDD